MMALTYLKKMSGSSRSNCRWKRFKSVCAGQTSSRLGRGGNLFEINSFLLLNRRLDPVNHIFETVQVDTSDGERLAIWVVQEFMTNAIAEDHGDITGEFAIYKLQSRVSVLLVEYGNVRCGFFKATRPDTTPLAKVV